MFHKKISISVINFLKYGSQDQHQNWMFKCGSQKQNPHACDVEHRLHVDWDPEANHTSNHTNQNWISKIWNQDQNQHWMFKYGSQKQNPHVCAQNNAFIAGMLQQSTSSTHEERVCASLGLLHIGLFVVVAVLVRHFSVQQVRSTCCERKRT